MVAYMGIDTAFDVKNLRHDWIEVMYGRYNVPHPFIGVDTIEIKEKYMTKKKVKQEVVSEPEPVIRYVVYHDGRYFTGFRKTFLFGIRVAWSSRVDNAVRFEDIYDADAIRIRLNQELDSWISAHTVPVKYVNVKKWIEA